MTSVSPTSSPSPSGSEIDLVSYCKDPAKYSSQPQHVKDMYAYRCKIWEEVEKNINESTGGTAVGMGLLDMIGQLPYMMTFGMIEDPSQLAMWFLTDKFALSKSFWLKHADKVFAKAGLYMKNWGYSWVQRLAAQGGKVIPAGTKVATGLGRYMLNRVALGRALVRATSAVLNVTTGLVRNTVRGFLMIIGTKFVVLAAFAAVMALVNKIFIVQMLIQMIGMIVDTIDPCNLNKSMDATTMDEFAKGMNDSFKKMMIPQATIIPSVDDTVKFYNRWPIDIEVEKLFPTNAQNDPGGNEDYRNAQLREFGLSEKRMQDLESLQMEYQFLYLVNMRYNAFGQPLSFPENYDPPDVTPEMMNAMQNHVLASLANNNVVVSRWLYRYSPLILAGIVMLLFFIYKYV